MISKRLRALIATLALGVPLMAGAGPFSSMYVFGDSLSDTGNLANVSGGSLPHLPCVTGFCGPYYNNQQLSNGPVWVEAFAAGLGLGPNNAAPFTVGGNNFAFAGAVTGVGLSNAFDPPGLLTQSFHFFGADGALPAVDPNALYVVIGGGNDMRASRSSNPGVTAVDQAAHLQAAIDAVNNLGQTIAFLASKGARNVMISTLPDLGLTPEANIIGLQAASSDATNKFNALLPSLFGLETLFPLLDISLFDLGGLTSNIVANPQAYGFLSTSMPCAGFEYSLGNECATSLFADVLHPSARAHDLIARNALALYNVPEPDSLALVALAMVAIVLVRRQSRKAA